MAFAHSFGNNRCVDIDVSSDDGEAVLANEAASSALEEDSSVLDILDSNTATNKEEVLSMSCETEEDDPPAPTSRMKGALKELWLSSENCGLCTGSNELRCYFGQKGQAANAEPGGRCDLCSSASLRALHEHPRGQARITYLLKNLTEKPLLHGYARIAIALGEEAREMYRFRRERALYRTAQRAKAKSRRSRPSTATSTQSRRTTVKEQ